MEQRPHTPPLRLTGTDRDRPGLVAAPVSQPQPAEEFAKLTHELANLLDGSQRHLNLALRHLSEDREGSGREEVLKQLRVLHTALDRMNQVVGTFRGGRRGRVAGAAEIDSVDAEPMAAVLQHAADVIEPAATERRVTIEVDLAHGLEGVTAGPIYPVIANALRNALEACEPGGRIHLSAELAHGQTIISVRDDGCGIDPAMLGRVFELGATTKQAGSGIGLALSKEIVEQAGGTITLVNNPDRGATLRVTLPVRPRQ